jgi:hypothetical protein
MDDKSQDQQNSPPGGPAPSPPQPTTLEATMERLKAAEAAVQTDSESAIRQCCGVEGLPVCAPADAVRLLRQDGVVRLGEVRGSA